MMDDQEKAKLTKMITETIGVIGTELTKNITKSMVSAIQEMLSRSKWTTTQQAIAVIGDMIRNAPPIHQTIKAWGDQKHGRISSLMTPLDVITDQMLKAVEVCSQFVDADIAEWTDQLKASIADLILRARPFLWSDDCRVAAGNLIVNDPKGKEIVLIREMVPELNMWWSFPNDLTAAGSEYELCGMSVNVIADALVTFRIQHKLDMDKSRHARGHELIKITPIIVPFGTRIQDLGENNLIGSDALMITGMLIFLNSPYIPRTLRPAFSRQMRRATQTKHPLPDVTFLNLRNPIRQNPIEPGDGTREYYHQWLVRGHIRQQWFPSKQIHLPVWIPPYIKGPEGAPMLTSVPHVIR